MPEDHSRLSTRRKFLGVSGAALAAAAMGQCRVVDAQRAKSY